MRLAIKLVSIVALALIFSGLGQEAAARSWRSTPEDQAREYLMINDQRSASEMVMLIWMAPALIPAAPANKDARDIMAKYGAFGVVHANMDQAGNFKFTEDEDIKIRVSGATTRTAMAPTEIPPVVGGIVEALGAMFKQALGPLGKALRWHVFDTADLDSCDNGQLAVFFAGEKYTYDTPLPGCPGTK
jgi:hypothetical protein